MILFVAYGRPAGWRATVGAISLSRWRAAAERRGSRRAVATILERVSSHGGSIHNSQLGHPTWTASDVTRHVRVPAKLAVGISTATHRRLLYGCRAHVTVGMRRERPGQYSTALSESPAPPLVEVAAAVPCRGPLGQSASKTSRRLIAAYSHGCSMCSGVASCTDRTP